MHRKDREPDSDGSMGHIANLGTNGNNGMIFWFLKVLLGRAVWSSPYIYLSEVNNRDISDFNEVGSKIPHRKKHPNIMSRLDDWHKGLDPSTNLGRKIFEKSYRINFRTYNEHIWKNICAYSHVINIKIIKISVICFYQFSN